MMNLCLELWWTCRQWNATPYFWTNAKDGHPHPVMTGSSGKQSSRVLVNFPRFEGYPVKTSSISAMRHNPFSHDIYWRAGFPTPSHGFLSTFHKTRLHFQGNLLRLVSMRFLWFCHAPGVFNPGFASGFPTELIVSSCHFEVGVPVDISRFPSFLRGYFDPSD